MKMFYYFLLFLVVGLMVPAVKSDAVCDLNTFLVEVKQDLADNGMLDCLRVIDPPHFVEETEDQKNLRLAAQWDTSCAFESSSNWVELIKKNYGISNLVDSVGEIVKQDFEDQADLCEILRAAVAKNIFDIPDLNMQKLPMDIIDKIDCAGVGDTKRAGPRICAASGGSYFQKDSWTIFLEPSALKLGGKPEFELSDDQPEPIRNPYNNNSDPTIQTKLIKDLMKFTKDQLDIKQGELANMIDKAQSEESNPNTEIEKENETGRSKQAYVHVKRLKEVSFRPNKKFFIADGAQNKFKVDGPRIIFGFYMASLKFEKKGDAYFKLQYDNREIPESRQLVSETKLATLTGAFGEVFSPKKNKNNVEISLLYETSEDARVSTDAGEENFSFGAITFPEGHVYKKINSGTLEFSKSDKWNLIQNFSLNINFNEKKEAYFLIMYNLSFPVPNKAVFESRLKFGKNVIPETSINCGPSKMVGSHSGIVLRVKPGNTVVGVEYKYNGDQVQLQDFTDPHYIQSISAFQLPDSTEVKNFKLDKSVNLESAGEWKSFGLEASIELIKKQTILIIYNINLKVDHSTFLARVRMDSKYNKKSVFGSTGQVFATGQGYVVKVMKPGKYTFDIDYKSNAKNVFDPNNSELDGQVVNMQIILLD